ncbi:MAG: flavodoxin domain-containing protein [Anaerolineae bacterium]|nr:flavodoxin domain-containing protein [Anaerolineae bacterium]
MSNITLVTYASRAGSTAGVAQAVAHTLKDRGIAVEVCPMRDVQDITRYRAVVAGSAVRMSQWLPEGMAFVEHHRQQLLQKPFAAFVVCLAMAAKSEKGLEKVTAAAYLQPVRTLVPTVSEGLFAGVLDLSKLPLMYRIPFRLATLSGIFKEGDYRDWNTIHQWANDLLPKLVV